MEFGLIGNKNIKSVLENAFKTGHIPHAIIIEGEEGMGKKTLARYIAKCCVCEGENTPCNKCSGCHLADVGSHPDIRVIEPEAKKKNIEIGQIRAARNEAYVVPQMAARKVFIINKADTMNQNSANALLKVLEEPPGNTVFILITEYSASLLATVRSRCITFTMQTPAFNEARALIKEQTNASDEQIVSALEKTNCNIGKTLGILNNTEKILSYTVAEEFFSAFLKYDQYAMLLALQKLDKDRAATEDFFAKLKVKIAEQIKADSLEQKSTKRLFETYKILNKASESLPFNISLPLLFSNICANINSLER